MCVLELDAVSVAVWKQPPRSPPLSIITTTLDAVAVLIKAGLDWGRLYEFV